MKKVKDYVKKNPEPAKGRFGVNPFDPWSVKYNVAEKIQMKKTIIDRIQEARKSGADKFRQASYDREKAHKEFLKSIEDKPHAEKMKAMMDKIKSNLNKEEVELEEGIKSKAAALAMTAALAAGNSHAYNPAKPYDPQTMLFNLSMDNAKRIAAEKDKKKKIEKQKELEKQAVVQDNENGRGTKKMSNEETYADAKAATLSVMSPGEGITEKMTTKQRVKSIHKKLKEEMYDHEKEDKSVAPYGKKPKFEKTDEKDEKGENKLSAAAVLTGGKTLTGAPRDTIEIDPLMRNRPNQPDVTEKKSNKQSEKQEKK
jgi:hypothetical protein